MAVGHGLLEDAVEKPVTVNDTAPKTLRPLATPLLGAVLECCRPGNECQDIPELFKAAASRSPDMVAVTSEPLEDPDEEAEEEAGRAEAGLQSEVPPASLSPSSKPNHGRKTKLRRQRYALTYAELQDRVSALAAELRVRASATASGEEKLVPFVAICLERTVALTVAVLGVLTAGAAYVPLEPSHPGPRLKFLLEDSAAQLLITCWCARRRSLLPEARCIRLAAVSGDVLRFDSCDRDACSSNCPGLPTGRTSSDLSAADIRQIVNRSWDSSLAYLLYTSGSTGAPKGVVVPRRGVVNQLYAFDNMVRKRDNSDDLLLALATICFDIASLELLWPLCFGFRVLIANGSTRRSPPRLAAILDADRPSILQATPVTWRGLVHTGWKGHADLAGISGGEAFPPALVRPLLARCGAGMWNVYGPTETTLWCTAHALQASCEEHSAVSIGSPLANYFVFPVVPENEEDQSGHDTDMQGMDGELIIGGAGVSLGYHQRPELTSRRFVSWPPALLPHDFATVHDADREFIRRKQRVYRSGDLVRIREDKCLMFLGRLDFQVKFRGFRIELGEIEAVLERHPEVQQAVCILRSSSASPEAAATTTTPTNGSSMDGPSPQPKEDRLMLVAFVQLRASAPLEEQRKSSTVAALRAADWADTRSGAEQGLQLEQHPKSSSSGLRAFLAAQLPAYMIPRRVIALSEMPLNPNGKVDRPRLHALPLSDDIEAAEENAPVVDRTAPCLASAVADSVENVQTVLPEEAVVEDPALREDATMFNCLASLDWTAEEEGDAHAKRLELLHACIVAMVAEVTGLKLAERTAMLAEVTGVAEVTGENDEQSELVALGVDSVSVVPLAEIISRKVLSGAEFAPEELFSHTTIDSLCSAIARRLSEIS